MNADLKTAIRLHAELSGGFRVSPLMIRIARHFGAGALLSQILYWYAEDSKGNETKLRHIGEDGFYWLAKRYYEWEAETGMDEDEAMGYVKRLVKEELIITKTQLFGGKRSLHLRINEPVFLERFWNEINNPSTRNARPQSVENPVENTPSYPQTKTGKSNLVPDQNRKIEFGEPTKTGKSNLVATKTGKSNFITEITNTNNTQENKEKDIAIFTWKRVLEYVKNVHSDSPYWNTWAKEVVDADMEGDTIILYVRHEYARSWLHKGQNVSEALRAVGAITKYEARLKDAPS